MMDKTIKRLKPHFLDSKCNFYYYYYYRKYELHTQFLIIVKFDKIDKKLRNYLKIYDIKMRSLFYIIIYQQHYLSVNKK